MPIHKNHALMNPLNVYSFILTFAFGFFFTLLGNSGAVTLNFDTVNALAAPQGVPAGSYLAAFGVSVTAVTSGTSVVIIDNNNLYGGVATAPPSPPNLLTQVGSNDPVTFTLVFSGPLDSVSFTRAGLIAGINGVTHPPWSAHALDATGAEIGTVGEGLIASFSNVPSATFTLVGPGIKSVRFDSNNLHFAGFSAVLIDDLTLISNQINLPVQAEYQCGSPPSTPDGECNVEGASWACDPFDHPRDRDQSNTICVSGCNLTALSMALNYAHQAFGLPSGPGDPGSLNKFFIDQCLQGSPSCPYPVSALWPETATRAVAQTVASPYKFVGLDQSFRSDTAPGKTVAELDSILIGAPIVPAGGLGSVPVLVGVTGSQGDFPGHYVLVTGKNADGKHPIVDPGHRNNTILEDAYRDPTTGVPKYVLRGYVTDPSIDLSELDLAVNGNAEVLLIAPSGSQTGFDPKTGTLVNGIPASAYATDQVDDDSGGTVTSEVLHSIQARQPPQGPYNITVSGISAGSYTLRLVPYSQDGINQPVISISGMAAPGLTTSFLVDYTSTPGSATNVSGSFDGGGQRPRDVNKLLTYSNPTTAQTSLPAGTTGFALQVVYGNSIIPATFKAVMNGTEVSAAFSPRPASSQAVIVSLRRGRNVMELSVDGQLPTGRVATDKDRLVFLVQD